VISPPRGHLRLEESHISVSNVNADTVVSDLHYREPIQFHSPPALLLWDCKNQSHHQADLTTQNSPGPFSLATPAAGNFFEGIVMDPQASTAESWTQENLAVKVPYIHEAQL
jgi:hypothetical protein